jgi:hypothetical protein
MHRSLSVLFTLLSLTDLALTWWLLDGSGGWVYEANPIARWFLQHHGWPGMACFKVAVVFLVLGLTAIIFRYRPRAARGILGLGCASLALVVWYSTGLCQAPQQAIDEEASLQHLESMNSQIRGWNCRRDVMLVHLGKIREELLAERCTLREAVDRLATSDQGKLPDVLRPQLRLYPGRPFAECIAAFLISHVVNSLKEEPQYACSIACNLVREFEDTFSRAIPTMLADSLRRTGWQPRGKIS